MKKALIPSLPVRDPEIHPAHIYALIVLNANRAFHSRTFGEDRI